MQNGFTKIPSVYNNLSPSKNIAGSSLSRERKIRKTKISQEVWDTDPNSTQDQHSELRHYKALVLCYYRSYRGVGNNIQLDRSGKTEAGYAIRHLSQVETQSTLLNAEVG